MIEQIHKQIMEELDSTTSNDTFLVIGTVLYNFIAMAVCWGMAGNSYSPLFSDVGQTAIFFVLELAVIIFTVAALRSMNNSEAICSEYKAALRAMYEEYDVAKFLPNSMKTRVAESNQLRRTFVILSGALAVLIPLLDELL